MDAKDYQTVHTFPSGCAKVVKRKRDCFYVKFENGSEKKPICIRYSDSLHEDNIFLNKDLKDLRLKEEK
jgi:hypothetical protein